MSFSRNISISIASLRHFTSSLLTSGVADWVVNNPYLSANNKHGYRRLIGEKFVGKYPRLITPTKFNGVVNVRVEGFYVGKGFVLIYFNFLFRGIGKVFTFEGPNSSFLNCNVLGQT